VEEIDTSYLILIGLTATGGVLKWPSGIAKKNLQGGLDNFGLMDDIGHMVISKRIRAMATKEANTLRESILAASKELFARFGFKKTAVDEIAKKARVAKGTIYNYFRSKEEIYRAILQREGKIMIVKMREAMGDQKTSQLKLREMIIAKVKYYKDLSLLYEINRQRAEDLLPFVEKERAEIAKQELNLIKEILEEGASNSALQAMNIPATAKAIAAAINGLEIGWTLEMELEGATAEIDDLLQILFHGLELRTARE
jgi:AcrR family transcriptional regulator